MKDIYNVSYTQIKTIGNAALARVSTATLQEVWQVGEDEDRIITERDVAASAQAASCGTFGDRANGEGRGEASEEKSDESGG